MDRRNFIQRLTVASATGAAAHAADDSKSVTFRVNGFTCITCAVGLEVMLREQPGVIRAKASYPRQNVVIGYDSATTEATLRDFIDKTTGFVVAAEKN